MAIAKIIAVKTLRYPEFNDVLTVWMFDEGVQHNDTKLILSEVFNETKENVKYLPGITLPNHVKAVPDLKKAAQDADRRLGCESNREIVSCRACVRAQSVSLVRSRPQIRVPSPPPFRFWPTGLSLFPCEIRCSLSFEINEIKGIQMRSSESK